MNHTCNCAGKHCGHRGLGMFVLRVITGVVLAYAGWQKIQSISAIEASFVGMHFPAWMAVFVAWAQFLGGIALILGIFTCLVASVLAIIMAVAVVVSWKHGGFAGAEFALLTLASLIAVKHAGRGKWGMGRHCGCMFCGWDKKANVCMSCGHDPKMGEGCGCDCHK